jgi:hypothetical protein
MTDFTAPSAVAAPPDAPQDLALARWLAVLNSDRDEAAARALLAAAVEVEVFPEGKGGPTTRYSGLDHALTWLFRAKPGLYRFEALSAAPCDLAPGLPTSRRALRARYRVWATDPAWTWHNFGDWTLHIDDAPDPNQPVIVALVHAPDALTE